jgi:hypothetical protein
MVVAGSIAEPEAGKFLENAKTARFTPRRFACLTLRPGRAALKAKPAPLAVAISGTKS